MRLELLIGDVKAAREKSMLRSIVKIIPMYTYIIICFQYHMLWNLCTLEYYGAFAMKWNLESYCNDAFE